MKIQTFDYNVLNHDRALQSPVGITLKRYMDEFNCLI